MQDEETGHFTEDGQIVFIDGKGYALTPASLSSGQAIYLGDEVDILKFLETGELSPDLDSEQISVLKGIRKFRERFGIGILQAS